MLTVIYLCILDADVEDNVEGYPEKKMEPLHTHESHLNGTTDPPPVTDAGHLNTTEITHFSEVLSTKESIQTCLGGAEDIDKYENPQTHIDDIDRNGITESCKAFEEVVESKGCDINNLTEHISVMTVSEEIGDGDLSMKHESMTDILKSNQDGPTKIEDNIVKSKTEFWQEAALKAVNTLAPRYQPTSQECSVLSCLHQFTSAELLTGQNRFGCSHCTKQKHKDKGMPLFIKFYVEEICIYNFLFHSAVVLWYLLLRTQAYILL